MFLKAGNDIHILPIPAYRSAEIAARRISVVIVIVLKTTKTDHEYDISIIK